MRNAHFLFLLFTAVILCGFSRSSTLVFSQENQEVNIDEKLIKDIIKGHHALEQATEFMSGKISFMYSNSDTNAPPIRHVSYYKSNDLLRLDCTNPQKGTTISPNNKNNDITEVYLSTKEYNYRYHAVSTTGTPFANLHRTKRTNSLPDLAYTNVFFSPIRSLYSLEAMRITDLLQDRIGKIEFKTYENIPNALWIHSVEHVTKTSKSNWTVVLNPDECYALAYYELSVINTAIKFSTETKSRILSQRTEDGKIFAKEVNSTSITNGRTINEKYVITVDSTSKPEDRIFTEDCFKQLGRDYVIVVVLPNQKEKVGTFVEAAPLSTRMRNIEVTEMPTNSAWPWSRISILLLGIIFIVMACTYKYFHSKK